MLSLHKLKSTQEVFPNGLTKEALGKVTVFEVILIKTGLFVFNSLLLEEHVGENKNCSLQRSLALENFSFRCKCLPHVVKFHTGNH